MYRIVLLLTSLATILAAGEGADPTGAPGSGGSGSGGASGGSGSGLVMFLPLAVILGLFWFMTRSQRKEEAKRKELVNSVKRGDQVVTIGGIHGEVVSVGEGTVDLEVAKDTVIRFNKGAVSSVATAVAAVSGKDK